MKFFIGYASTEGQSRKIARWVADRLLDDCHGVELASVEDGGELDLHRFERAIIVGSIHVGQYKKALADFAADHHVWLNAHPVLFLSVSLAAAGHDAEEWRALERILADFQEATDWKTASVAQIAGAYMPSEYDIVTRFIMRRIVAKKDPEADLSEDRDYTDWAALGDLLEGWVAA